MKTRIGIVGGGQLGRMLTFEAKKMGFIVYVLDPTPRSPAGQVADEQIIGDYKDHWAIRKLAEKSDYLTFELELANAEILDELAEKGIRVNPSAETLSIIKDKLLQKKFLKKAGMPVAEFREVKTRDDIFQIGKIFSYPFFLKARFDSYDGRGNALITTVSDIDEGIKKLSGRLVYGEKYMRFTRELAIMVARNTKGEIATYPVVETMHKNNICHTVIAPAPVADSIKKRAELVARKAMTHLKGAGVFGIEMFLTKENEIIINEIAPRVHNSGHYTIEACTTSQFEQHIRAITGMPLGSTNMLFPSAVMVNILGERNGKAEPAGLEKTLALPHVSVHIYGKKDTKLERKMGHITVLGKDPKATFKTATLARKYMTI